VSRMDQESTARKPPGQRRSFTDEFKANTVRPVKPVSAVARDLDLTSSAECGERSVTNATAGEAVLDYIEVFYSARVATRPWATRARPSMSGQPGRS